MTGDQGERRFIGAAREALQEVRWKVTERPAVSGCVWILEGTDEQGNYFAVGAPEGRAAAWLRVCRLAKVSVDLERSS